MMESVVVFVTAVFLVIGLPVLIGRMMRRARRKRQGRPLGMGFEGAFDALDPARARALQTIQVREEIGQSEESHHGELVDRKDARLP
jgi:hypothetical protein